jgi:hypothetical protein
MTAGYCQSEQVSMFWEPGEALHSTKWIVNRTAGEILRNLGIWRFNSTRVLQKAHTSEMPDADPGLKLTGAITFTISILAFLRPNIEALYKKLFKKPKVKIICLNQAEIGFNLSGSYLISHVTFLGSNGDVVISRVDCELTNLKTGTSITQPSFIFVADEIPPGPSTFSKPILLPNGGVITHQIQFAQWTTYNQINRLASAFAQSVPRPDPASDPDFAQLKAAMDATSVAEKNATADEIGSYRFWTEGKHRMKLSIVCQGECVSESPEFEFEVPPEFGEKMKAAHLRTMDFMVGYPTAFEAIGVTLTPIDS